VESFISGLSGGVLGYFRVWCTNQARALIKTKLRGTSSGLTLGRIPAPGRGLSILPASTAPTARYLPVLVTIRELGEGFRLEVQGGQQWFKSPLTAQNGARFLNISGDWFLGRHYFLGGGLLIYRGDVQDYDQILLNLGYRF
jgi:hypothetical protein